MLGLLEAFRWSVGSGQLLGGLFGGQGGHTSWFCLGCVGGDGGGGGQGWPLRHKIADRVGP